MEEQLKREIAIMRKLNHPNVTQLYEVFQTTKHVYLILELVCLHLLDEFAVRSGKSMYFGIVTSMPPRSLHLC